MKTIKENLSGKKEVGIFYNPWKSTFDHKKSVLELYRRAVFLKANPRNQDYMKTLFAEHSPDGDFVNIQSDSDWQSKISLADTIVLLYPDSTGINFSTIESTLKLNKQKWATVRVLNGRRRTFVLNRSVMVQLRLRRFIEQTMLGEALIMIAFLIISPFFLISDFFRGRQ